MEFSFYINKRDVLIMAVCLLLVVERRQCNFKCNIFADTAGEVNTAYTLLNRLKRHLYTNTATHTHTH